MIKKLKNFLLKINLKLTKLQKKLILKNLIDVKEDGTFNLDQDFFNYSTGLTMTNEKFNNFFIINIGN